MQGILREMCKDAQATPQSAAKSLMIEKITGKALEALIQKEKLDIAGMMAKYRLRVDASEAQLLMKNAKK